MHSNQSRAACRAAYQEQLILLLRYLHVAKPHCSDGQLVHLWQAYPRCKLCQVSTRSCQRHTLWSQAFCPSSVGQILKLRSFLHLQIHRLQVDGGIVVGQELPIFASSAEAHKNSWSACESPSLMPMRHSSPGPMLETTLPSTYMGCGPCSQRHRSLQRVQLRDVEYLDTSSLDPLDHSSHSSDG